MEVSHKYQRRTLFCKSEHLSTQGFVERREYPMQERLRRMFTTLGLLLGAAIVAVFVPILYFVLVPVLLLCALVFGIATWVDKAEILRGEYTCPQCKKINSLARESENFPRSTRCQHCYFTLHLDLKP